MIQVVIDTNVVLSAMRSRKGASFALIRTMESGVWQPNISATLLLEYEAVLYRHAHAAVVPTQVCDAVIGAFAALGRWNPIYFRWRSFLADPADDFLLELALASAAEFVVTFNLRHLVPLKGYGIRVVTPAQFLRIMEERAVMSRTVQVPDEIYLQVQRAAAERHVSVDDLIASALNDQLAAYNAVKRRAALYSPEAFSRALAQIPDAEPDDRDRL